MSLPWELRLRWQLVRLRGSSSLLVAHFSSFVPLGPTIQRVLRSSSREANGGMEILHQSLRCTHRQPRLRHGCRIADLP